MKMTTLRLPKNAYNRNRDVYSLSHYSISHYVDKRSGIYGTESIIDRKWFRNKNAVQKKTVLTAKASTGVVVLLAIATIIFPNAVLFGVLGTVAFGAFTMISMFCAGKAHQIIHEAERIEFEGIRKALNSKFHNRNLIEDSETHAAATAVLAGKDYSWVHGSVLYELKWSSTYTSNDKYEIFKKPYLSKNELAEIEQSEALGKGVAVWREQLGEYVTSQHEEVKAILLTIKRKAYALSEEKSLTGERVYQVQRILNDSLTAVNITKRLSAQTEKNEDSTLLPILETLSDELTEIQGAEAQNIQYELEKHALFIESRK